MSHFEAVQKPYLEELICRLCFEKGRIVYLEPNFNKKKDGSFHCPACMRFVSRNEIRRLIFESPGDHSITSEEFHRLLERIESR